MRLESYTTEGQRPRGGMVEVQAGAQTLVGFPAFEPQPLHICEIVPTRAGEKAALEAARVSPTYGSWVSPAEARVRAVEALSEAAAVLRGFAELLGAEVES